MPNGLQSIVFELFFQGGKLFLNFWIFIEVLLLGLIFYILIVKRPNFKIDDNRGVIKLMLFYFIFSRFPTLIRGECGVDESEWIAGALTLLQDPRFWLSVDGTTSGPLVIFPLCLLKVFGQIGFGEIRVFGILIWCLIIIFTQKGLALYSTPYWANISILPLIVCISQFDFYNFVGYNSEHIPILLFSLHFWLISEFIHSNSKAKSKWIAYGIGFIASVSSFAKLQAIPLFALGILFSLLLMFWKKRNFNLFVCMMLGVSTPIFLVGAYLMLFGMWDDFYQSYIVSNLFYISDGFETVPIWAKVINFPKYILMISETKFYFILVIVFPFICWLMLVKGLKKLIISDRFISLLFFFYLIVALYIIFQPGRQNIYFTHYILFLIVPSVLFFATSIKWFGQLYPKWTLFGVLLFSFSLFVQAQWRPNETHQQILTKKLQENGTESVSSFIKTNFPKARSLAVWGYWNRFYVETQLCQGTREPHTYHQLRKSELQKYFLDRYLKDLQTNRPDVFINNIGWEFSSYKNDPAFQISNFYTIKNFIQSNYTLKASIRGNLIYFLDDSKTKPKDWE